MTQKQRTDSDSSVERSDHKYDIPQQDAEILANHWANKAVANEYHSRTGHPDCAKRADSALAKLQQLEGVVGAETMDGFLAEANQRHRREAGDRDWHRAMFGSPLELEAVGYECDRATPITLDEACPPWAVREAAKRIVNLLPEMPAPHLALVMHLAAHDVTDTKVESPDCSHHWLPVKLPNAGDNVERCDECGALRDNRPFDDEVLEYAQQSVDSLDG